MSMLDDFVEIEPALVKVALVGSVTGVSTQLAPPSWLDWTSPDTTKVVIPENPTGYVVYQEIDGRIAAERVPAERMLSLAAVCAEMRELIDLPVQDLARMVGVRRRQFYNLMSGETPAMRSSEDERYLRLVHDHLKNLHALSRDASSLRSAALTPLPELEGRSFYQAAQSGDAGFLNDGYRALASMLQAGVKIREQLPPSGTFPPGDPRWKDAAAVLFGDSSVE